MSDVTGGSSTQSSLANATPKVLSLTDEKGVVTLLRHIHQSSLDPDDKNELRDAIFVFRNSSDVEPSPELVTKFAGFGFSLDEGGSTHESEEVIVSTQVPTPAKNSIGQLGATRPSPQFAKVVAPVTQEVSTPVQTPASVAKPTVETETIPGSMQTEPTIVQEEVVVPKSVNPVVESVVESAPMPKVEPVVEENIVVPPVTVPAPPEPEITASALVADTAGALERIKEIKKEVNLLVGNPVNLIDVHNEVGREYMNALLDAMKKNNGGTLEQVTQAMNRLEKAFSSVKETVGVAGTEETKQVESTAQPESQAEAVVSAVSEIPVSVTPEVPVVPEPVAQPVEQASVQSGFAPAPQSNVQDTATPSEQAVAPEVLPATEETAPVAEPVTPVPPQAPVMPIQESVAPVQGFSSVSGTEEQKPLASNAGGIMSVAKEKQLQDLMTSKKQQEAMTDQQQKAIEIAAMDPLMTPEVTNGLQQLLSEWSLFKSSGIFGTGPSGVEHQLYKKLATLNMTAVVAGRFEGATPEIKRSITDYMNGWRYEEGILQEQGELFEHYLRRVIKHILDKRKVD